MACERPKQLSFFRLLGKNPTGTNTFTRRLKDVLHKISKMSKRRFLSIYGQSRLHIDIKRGLKGVFVPIG